MIWLSDIFLHNSTAHAILILALVISAGILLGKIRFFGVSFGIAGVLFAGILAAHFQLGINEEIADFVKDFGLILFVYSIGLQVGPGFFASWRRQGLVINLLAAAVVGLGVALAVLLRLLFSLPVEAVVGILTGAVTNTPSLGAAQQALNDMAGASAAAARQAGLGYAVAYPFGVLGVILAVVLTRRIFRIGLAAEKEAFQQAQAGFFPAPETVNLEVTNPQLVGRPLSALAGVIQADIVVSRILRGKELFTPVQDTLLQSGDVLLVVGSKPSLEKLRLLVGGESAVDLKKISGPLIVRHIVVSQKKVIGRSLAEMQLRNRYGVNITRVHRAGIEFVPSPGVRLQFGDRLTVVGSQDMVAQLAGELGNSLKELDIPEILPVFLGIIAGVLLGSLPLPIPGLPMPLKLGLAGGPLVMAILISRFGNIGRFSSYVPRSANLMLREVGIVLFLACVGLRAGAGFVPTLVRGQGLTWLGCGALITLLPLALVVLFARLVLKKNYLELCGLMAGSMTDPPALAFANAYVDSDAPAVTYATVYPLVTFLRIVSAQLLVLFFLK
jgi:putative transport protein